MVWQVQEGKQKFSALLRAAETEGPQVISRHGEDVAVVMSAEEYERVKQTPPKMSFEEALMSSPPFDDIETYLERNHSLDREVEL